MLSVSVKAISAQPKLPWHRLVGRVTFQTLSCTLSNLGVSENGQHPHVVRNVFEGDLDSFLSLQHHTHGEMRGRFMIVVQEGERERKRVSDG